MARRRRTSGSRWRLNSHKPAARESITIVRCAPEPEEQVDGCQKSRSKAKAARPSSFEGVHRSARASVPAAKAVRPHMIAVRAPQTHAIVSSSPAATCSLWTRPLELRSVAFRTSVGAEGARQVHFAIASPDESYVAVANQNGRLFERIDTNYATSTFVLNLAAGIDLANCVTPNGVACQDPLLRPGNAPICPGARPAAHARCEPPPLTAR